MTGRDGKDLYLSGVFVQGNVRNGNGRIYPDSEIENAVQDIMGRISSGYTVLGECDHPEKLDINLDRVSHMIEKMWVQGSSGYGKLKNCWWHAYGQVNTGISRVEQNLV